MTSLVDIAVEIPGNLDTIESELKDAVTASKTDTTKTVVDKTTADVELPEKLRGKSLKDIADMYRNLESAHGRMANDLGAQRQLTDRLLELKRNDDLKQSDPGTRKPEKVVLTTADLLEKPTEALERFADSRESAVEARVNERLNRIEATVVQREFAAKHPDANVVAQSTEFVDWVKQSPVRQRAAQAAVAGHFGAADDLLTEFKALKPAKKAEEDTADADNKAAARSASLDSGSAAGVDPGNKKAGKVYSRADLMRLRIEKPETYYNEDFQQEITIAYAQGRVK